MHPGAYRGNKRQKELKRLAKQEEKRQKRLVKDDGTPVAPEEPLVPLDGPVHHFADELPPEGEGETPAPETPAASEDPQKPEPAS